MHFNSHAHVERDQRFTVLFKSQCHFNSHAHVERDEIIGAIIDGFKDFNSHAHVERDLPLSVYVEILPFQLTRSRGA